LVKKNSINTDIKGKRGNGLVSGSFWKVRREKLEFENRKISSGKRPASKAQTC